MKVNRLLLFLLVFSLIAVSFKDRVYSTTDALTGILLDSNPGSIAINPLTNEALITDEKADSVSVVNLDTQEVTAVISVGKAPKGVAVDKELNIAAVTNSKDNTVTLIDLYSYEAITTIPVGKHPIDVVINPLDNCALVICKDPVKGSGDRTLLLIDLDTNTIIENYVINKQPKAVAVNNFTNIAGIVDSKTDLPTGQAGSLTLIQLPNPVPELSSINPETVLRGSTDISINIQGSEAPRLQGGASK